MITDDEITEDFDEQTEDPLDTLLAEDTQPAPPMGPDGSFMPQLPVELEPIAEATPENMICLRGPCRFYLEMDTNFQAGNTRGTLERKPIQRNRFCRVIPGDSIPLTDEVVSACSEWDPLVPADTLRRNANRKKWLSKNPEFKEEK